MQQRYLYVFIGIGIVLLGGVFWVWSKKTKQIPAQNQTPAEESVDTPKAELLDTSDWMTYRNEKFGYSLQYPSNWYVETKNSNSDLTTRGTGEKMGGDTLFSNYRNPSSYNLGNIPVDLFIVHLFIYRVDPAIRYEQFAIDENYEFDDMQEISLSNRKAVRLTGMTHDHPNGLAIVSVLAKSRDKMFDLTYSGKSTDLTAIADEIVRSFKIE